MSTLKGSATLPGQPGVEGDSAQYNGVAGTTTSASAFGVAGVNESGGNGTYGRGVTGVIGHGIDPAGGGSGVTGYSDKAIGVLGTSTANVGVYGRSTASMGVLGESQDGEGVRGVSHNQNHGGVVGICDSTSGGTGVYGKCDSGYAGRFDGNILVTGVVSVGGDLVLLGADLAEQFGVIGDIRVEPGCVVVLAGDDQVRMCEEPYDRRVAGVVSGAGGYRPALVMDRRPDPSRRALALTGKVWCKVDADYGAVALGDPLTTSATPGHAMRADDQGRAFGAVVGKALAGLASGQGLVPVLVALR